MKISGHNYQNNVFDSLLDGLKGDVVLTKKAEHKAEVNVSGSDVFSSTTEDTLASIQNDELQFIAAELQFAADKANVSVNADNLAAFAKEAQADNLRGKKLERAAQKFCNKISRTGFVPQSSSKISSDLLSSTNNHGIKPAGYPSDAMSNSRTGGFMGMSKNPNTIWDAGVLHKQASVPQEHHAKNGDEQIKSSKADRENYKQTQKEMFWQEIQDTLSDKSLIRNSISNISTGNEVGTSQKLPANAMSMFSDDKDFANIPEKTAGENLKVQSETRSQKSKEAKGEWNKSVPAKKADNSGSALLETSEQIVHPSSHRSAIDKLFEGIGKNNS